jgi:Domain of unknown function (DUF4920)
MKYTFLVLLLVAASFCKAQEIPSAEKGVNYGKPFKLDSAVSVAELESKLTEGKYSGKITGKVVEVCQVKGCWIKIDKGNGETVLAKTSDEFFMPANIVGKTVMMNADASIKERSVKELKHYAEDAGKSKEEIEKITTPKKELVLKLKGVTVIE